MSVGLSAGGKDTLGCSVMESELRTPIGGDGAPVVESTLYTDLVDWNEIGQYFAFSCKLAD